MHTSLPSLLEDRVISSVLENILLHGILDPQLLFLKVFDLDPLIIGNETLAIYLLQALVKFLVFAVQAFKVLVLLHQDFFNFIIMQI